MRFADLPFARLQFFFGALLGAVAIGSICSVSAARAQTNHAPMLARPLGPFSVAEGGVLSFTVTATDADGDALSFSAPSLPIGATLSSTGAFRWTPDFTQAGSYGVAIVVSDAGLTDTENVALTVTNVNRPPVLTTNPPGPFGLSPVMRISFVVLATDPDGDAVTIGAENLPAGATFVDGVFDWLPSNAQLPELPVFFFGVDDGEPPATSILALDFIFTGENSGPVLRPIADQAVNENETLAFGVTATDPDGDPVQFRANGLPQGAVFDGFAGDFSWTPSFEQAGTYELSITAVDSFGAASETADVTLTVHNTNRAPVLTPVRPEEASVGGGVSFTVLARDPDGDRLTYAFTSTPPLPGSERALDAISGAFRYTAPEDSAGDYTLTITATDSGTPVASASIAVSLTIVECGPILLTVPSEVTGEEGAALRFTAYVLDDLGGESVTISALGLPKGVIFDREAGLFEWPSPAEGEYAIAIHAANDCGRTEDATLRLTILPAGCDCATCRTSRDRTDRSLLCFVGLLCAIEVGRRSRALHFSGRRGRAHP